MSKKILFFIWNKSFEILRKHPVVVVPFLMVALFDAVILAVLTFSRQQPLSSIIGPAVSALCGKEFFHYPGNFLMLPKVFNYVRTSIGFSAGLFFTSIAVSLIRQAEQDISPKLWFGIKKTIRRYFRLTVIWSVNIGLYFSVLRIFKNIGPYFSSNILRLVMEFISVMSLQVLFAFAIPAVIIENKKITLAFKRSVMILKLYPVTAFLFVMVPGLLLIPVNFLNLNIPLLSADAAPRATMNVLFLYIIAITVIDFFITSSATILFLMHRKNEIRSS